MSQQSNPATLREALAREIADEFCGGSEAVFEAILAKLAASGTEAAPTITPEILMDAVAMVQDEGLWKFDQPKWYEAMAEALEHLRKPAQAAASPEGEGRERLCDFRPKGERWHCIRPRWHRGDHSPFVVDTINADGPAASRQSAAPSGVDMREAWFEYLRSLAQESKTGAVTETK